MLEGFTKSIYSRDTNWFIPYSINSYKYISNKISNEISWLLNQKESQLRESSRNWITEVNSTILYAFLLYIFR